MTPRTGRPTDNPKNIRLEIRIAQDTAKTLQECADQLQTSRAEVIVKGVNLVKSELDKKK